jgi:hypothetical protein
MDAEAARLVDTTLDPLLTAPSEAVATGFT